MIRNKISIKFSKFESYAVLYHGYIVGEVQLEELNGKDID